MTAQDKNSRLLPLDFLRGVAILLVLMRHSPLASSKVGYIAYPFALIGRMGWTGVDLFFVLSGFLIGGLLFREIATRETLDIKRFIIRRGFKIWPSYYLNILVGTLIVYLNTPEAGGNTVFPDAGLDVAPVRGNAVFFSYDRAHASTKTLHGGAPVTAGEKWVATKWLREGVFV